MQLVSLGRSGIAQTAVVSLLTLAAVVLLGLVLAYWTWVWFAPSAPARAAAAAAPAANLAPASLLFGRAERKQNAAAQTGIAITLLGVVAASGGRRGYAVVQLETKQILAVHEGENVASGIRLAEVHPDHVILERRGARETLAWPLRNAGASATPSNSGIAAARAAAARMAAAASEVAQSVQGAAEPPASQAEQAAAVQGGQTIGSSAR